MRAKTFESSACMIELSSGDAFVRSFMYRFGLSHFWSLVHLLSTLAFASIYALKLTESNLKFYKRYIQ